MGLESATYVSDLVSTNPTGSDLEKQGDDHLRLIKAAAKATFPNASAPFYFPVSSTKSADFTVGASDQNAVFLVSASGAARTATLTAAATLGSRFRCKIVKTDSSANTVTVDANSSETIDGLTTYVLRKQWESVELYCDGSAWYTGTQRPQRALPPTWRSGCAISNNGSDATNDIDIAVGAWRDSGDNDDIYLVTALTKQLDAAWAVGTNQGMRASGAAIANTTYHIFLIKRNDTGVVDIAADTSVTGANIAANTNAAYTIKRRIGSILREGGAIVGFSQLDTEFLRNASVLDVNAGNPGTGAVTRTLSVAVGAKVLAIMNVSLQNSGSGVAPVALITELDRTDEAASLTAAPLGSVGLAGAVAGFAQYQNTGHLRVRTNTSGQVRSRLASSDASCTLRIATFGWVDVGLNLGT